MLCRLARSLEPGSPPLFVEVVSDSGLGRTTLLGQLAERLEREGFEHVTVPTFPGVDATRRGLDLLCKALDPSENPVLQRFTTRAMERSRSLRALLEKEPEDWRALVPAMEERFGRVPLLLLIDDASFLDPLLLRVLFQVLAAVGTRTGVPPTMAVAVGGDLDLPERHPCDLQLKPLHLAPLAQGAVAELIQARGLDMPVALRAAQVLEAMGRHDLFTAVHLAEELRLGSRATLAEMERLLATGGRLLAVRRYTRLPEPAQRLLRAAAVMTSGINRWRCERLGGFEREDVDRLTCMLEALGWLRRAYPHGLLRFVFRHEDRRRIVYEQIPAAERPGEHERMASLLQADHLDPEGSASEIGRHLALAGRLRAGADWLLRAGQKMLSERRLDDARRHFEEVLRLGTEHPDLRRSSLRAMEGLADIEVGGEELALSVRRYQAVLDEGEGVLEGCDRARLRRKQASRLISEGQTEDAKALIANGLSECRDVPSIERALLLDASAHLLARQGIFPRQPLPASGPSTSR